MPRFVWDPEKERRNRAEHGLAFNLAEYVLADLLSETFLDRDQAMEERWICIGAVDLRVLVLVYAVATYAGKEIVRVISLRQATRCERKAYFVGR